MQKKKILNNYASKAYHRPIKKNDYNETINYYFSIL